MDSRTRLDYALFQLTPTRTRCDLVIFAGKASEKLASGLLEPFLSHLNSAKQQISKGGYSITLQPSFAAPWFTKAVLERFVSFVGMPEVLERFVTLEQEIAQIEFSVNSNGPTADKEWKVLPTDGNTFMSAPSSKSSGDSAVHDDSKVHLQRVLKTRKVVLRKEQAMAYARALVAGFEINYIDDLISFADAFGALRLRKACINFMELYNKKNDDHVWRDEVAAMQAGTPSELAYLGTSGIILAGEDNGALSGGNPNVSIDVSASESNICHVSLDKTLDSGLPTSTQMPSTNAKAQLPMSWTNHLPQYMHNFQGHTFQHVHPFPGYHFPGLQTHGYYGQMPWPPNVADVNLDLDGELGRGQNHKSSSRTKVKSSHHKALQSFEQESNSGTNDSSSDSVSDEYEKHGKSYASTNKIRTNKHGNKSSRKVVIRNINYITAMKDGERGVSSSSSDEDEFVKGDSLKHQVEEAVGSLERHHKSSSQRSKHEKVIKKVSEGEKSNENWDIFQNLIMKDSDTGSNAINSQSVQEELPFSFGMESRETLKHHDSSNDSFIVAEKYSNESKVCVENFGDRENVSRVIKRDSTYEELLLSQRIEGSENFSRGAFSDGSVEYSIIKSHHGDRFIGNQVDKSSNRDESIDQNTFDYAESFDKDHTQSEKNKKDVFDDDSFMVKSTENSTDCQLRTDMFMVSDIVGATKPNESRSNNLREKVEAASMNEPDDLYMVLGRDTVSEQAMAPWNPEMDYGNHNSLPEGIKKHTNDEPNDPFDAKLPSHGKKTISRTNGAPERKLSSKEARPKASVGSLRRSSSEIISRSKKPPGSRTIVQKTKSELEEEKRRKLEELLIQRQKRISERSATSGNTPASSKGISKESKTTINSMKNEKLKIQASTTDTNKLQKPILRSSTIDRLAATRVTRNFSQIELKPSQPQRETTKGNGGGVPTLLHKKAGAEDKKINNRVKPSVKKKGQKTSNGLPNSVSDTVVNNESRTDCMAALLIETSTSHVTQPSNGNHDFDSVKKNVDIIALANSSEGNSCNGISSNGNLFVQTGSQFAQTDHLKGENKTISDTLQVLHEKTKVSSGSGQLVHDTTIDSLHRASSKGKISFSPEILVIESSTPPPENQMSPEPLHSRKKWGNGENAPKATKGFRKLLLFGLRS